jgi:hypothetical protein
MKETSGQFSNISVLSSVQGRAAARVQWNAANKWSEVSERSTVTGGVAVT